MSEKAPNQNVNMIRNIVVGVSTSVIGAASLYFLGINKTGGSTSSKASAEEVKEATTKGWKSYIADDNIYFKNSETISEEFAQTSNIADYKKAMLKEMQKFQGEVETILKEDDLDKVFVNMLNRRLEMEKETQVKVSERLDNFNTLMESNDPGKQQKMQQEYSKFMTDAKSIMARGATEAEGFAKALNEKYGQFFDLNESLAYKDYKTGGKYSANANTGNKGNNPPISGGNIPSQPVNNTTPAQNPDNTTPVNNNNTQLSAGMFAGNWTNEGGVLHLDNNGFSWSWNDGYATSTGGWRAQNNQIMFYVTGGYSANTQQLFNMYDITPNSFTLQLANNTSIVYHCYKQ